jgi:hypothetical protein
MNTTKESFDMSLLAQWMYEYQSMVKMEDVLNALEYLSGRP